MFYYSQFLKYIVRNAEEIFHLIIYLFKPRISPNRCKNATVDAIYDHMLEKCLCLACGCLIMLWVPWSAFTGYIIKALQRNMQVVHTLFIMRVDSLYKRHGLIIDYRTQSRSERILFYLTAALDSIHYSVLYSHVGI